MREDRRKRDRDTPDRRRDIVRDATPMAYLVAMLGLSVALTLVWMTR